MVDVVTRSLNAAQESPLVDNIDCAPDCVTAYVVLIHQRLLSRQLGIELAVIYFGDYVFCNVMVQGFHRPFVFDM